MTALAIDKPRDRAWWKELWIQVLIAMAAGILLGIVNPEAGAKMQPLGDAFIKAIRMLIAPIIFCAVVHGIAHMADMTRVGRVAVKAIMYFEVMTTIALGCGGDDRDFQVGRRTRWRAPEAGARWRGTRGQCGLMDLLPARRRQPMMLTNERGEFVP